MVLICGAVITHGFALWAVGFIILGSPILEASPPSYHLPMQISLQFFERKVVLDPHMSFLPKTLYTFHLS